MPEKPPSCVLLADRHHGLSEGVRGLLETAFATVVMVADEASLFEAAARLQPDVAVVDLSLARDASVDWLQELRQRCPDVKLIVLSVHDEESVWRASLSAGADAFVVKRAIVTDLLPAVEQLRQGRAGRCAELDDVEPDSKRATALGPGRTAEPDSPEPGRPRPPDDP